MVTLKIEKYFFNRTIKFYNYLRLVQLCSLLTELVGKECKIGRKKGFGLYLKNLKAKCKLLQRAISYLEFK